MNPIAHHQLGQMTHREYENSSKHVNHSTLRRLAVTVGLGFGSTAWLAFFLVQYIVG